MPCVANVVALSCIIAAASGLITSHSSNDNPGRKVTALRSTAGQPDIPLHGASKAPILSKGGRVGTPDMLLPDSKMPLHSKREESAASDAVISDHHSYFTCNGSSCDVNTTLMKAELQAGVVLFLGCSLDIYAIKHFCNSAHAELVGFSNNFAYMASCTMAGFTLVYVFVPGASPPPYWKDYVGLSNAQQIISQSSKDIVQKFGVEPAAIVVDSSLWDVSNWWQKAGMPPEPYPVPHADLYRWCNTDLAQLLIGVETAYPRSQIAFRTPAPVFPGNGYGQSSAIVDEMTKCARDKVDFVSHKVFNKYHLLDYNKLVETFFMHQTGPPLQYYDDVLHPGQRLSMEYMNAVLEWVRGSQHR